MHTRVLNIIEREKPCTALDITEFLGRDKAQVTRLIAPLIDQELVTKEPNPNDKRSQFLSITEAGAEIVNKVKRVDEETIEVITRNLNAEDVSEFQRIANLITRNLRSNNEK